MFTSKEFSQQLKEAGFNKAGHLMRGNGDSWVAYDLIYDLSIRYCKEVWGEKAVWTKCGKQKCSCKSDTLEYFADQYHPVEVLLKLQNGESQDQIESYIRTHSVLFNK